MLLFLHLNHCGDGNKQCMGSPPPSLLWKLSILCFLWSARHRLCICQHPLICELFNAAAVSSHSPSALSLSLSRCAGGCLFLERARFSFSRGAARSVTSYLSSVSALVSTCSASLRSWKWVVAMSEKTGGKGRVEIQRRTEQDVLTRGNQKGIFKNKTVKLRILQQKSFSYYSTPHILSGALISITLTKVCCCCCSNICHDIFLYCWCFSLRRGNRIHKME